ncbi:MAG: hypothetical protein GY913_25255 [Proteobacteria bacterium]|nr:hypothetical protein [Pseudomonadota bacterium]MCP4920222.1 hypothetical protein [Pseudomonadota bacterium]
MVGIPNFDPKPHLGPATVPGNIKTAGLVLTVLGIVAYAGTGFALEDGWTQARLGFLVSMNYFAGISFGGMAFLAAMTITEARWSRPLKRIAEGFAVFTPVVWVLFLLFYVALGGFDLYEWATHPETIHGHKHTWLQTGFFLGRNLAMLGLTSAVGLMYVRTSLKPDLILAKAEIGSAAPAWWDKIIGGETDAKAASEAAHKTMHTQAPLIGILYACAMTLYAFDAIMSLAPHWYANMFGGWYFASCFWLSMVGISLFALTSRGWLGIKHLVTPDVFHDIGKLIFAFTIVWAYMFFAQLLPIWYGNMTEEIGFLLVRMTLEPWVGLSKVVAAMCFLIPFATLLSRGLKKMPIGFGIILTIISVGIFLERFLVAVPSVWMEASIPMLPAVGIGLGWLGLFITVVTKYLGSVPAVPLTDPYMLPHPDDIHVHSRDAHDHAHGH